MNIKVVCLVGVLKFTVELDYTVYLVFQTSRMLRRRAFYACSLHCMHEIKVLEITQG